MLKSLAAAAFLSLAGSASAAIPLPSAAKPAATAGPDIRPEAYCARSGGAIQTRIPEYGTNGANPLALAHPREFCQYVSPDGSTQISVLLATLVAQQPTLAALAYYARVHVDLHTCQGGPGSCYCSDVGGTDAFGGISAAGGGWVLDSNVNDVLDVCVFPDASAIDAYGLFYHAYGIVRGHSLDHKFRYPSPY